MKQKQVTVNELVSLAIDELLRSGYSKRAVYGSYYPRFRQIAKYYEDSGITYYSIEATDEMLRLFKERLARSEITSTSYRMFKVTARRMNQLFITGSIHMPWIPEDEYLLTPENENLVDRYLEGRDYSTKARHDARWVIRKYIHHFEQLGHNTLEDVTLDEVREFILKTAKEVRPSSLHNILMYLKYFHRFLKENSIQAPECEELLSYTVYRDMPIQGYITDDDLEKIYSVIDMDSGTGKRNYAIISLAATTGLRAADIIKLKLDDINWEKSELSITQSKTGGIISLPLVEETADAIRNYILYARPSSECKEVFLRATPPCYAMSDSSTIGTFFRVYERKAGITRQAFDGKGFHGLRRRLAKKLLLSGTPVTSIAQILGHTELSSVRQYLSLDNTNIKECALCFNGIEVKRKELI